MLRQLRALLRFESPLPAQIHTHLDDGGRAFYCDETRCRPKPERPLPHLLLR